MRIYMHNTNVHDRRLKINSRLYGLVGRYKRFLSPEDRNIMVLRNDENKNTMLIFNFVVFWRNKMFIFQEAGEYQKLIYTFRNKNFIFSLECGNLVQNCGIRTNQALDFFSNEEFSLYKKSLRGINELYYQKTQNTVSLYCENNPFVSFVRTSEALIPADSKRNLNRS